MCNFRTLMSRCDVYVTTHCHFFFESHKNHASVKFAAETDDLDVCCVSAIALAFSGLLSSLDRCSCTLMYSFFGTLPSSLEVSERDHHM